MNARFFSIRIIPTILLILLLGVSLGYAQQPDKPEGLSAPQGLAGTTFTYQGQLKRAGLPVTATCDFIFTLYDAASGPPIPGLQQPLDGSFSVTGGLFSVTLDFGTGAFNGDGRWLGIQVKCPPDATYTDLGRQELTPTPLALALPGLWTQQNAESPNLIGGYSGNSVTPGVNGATISGGGSNQTPNSVTDYMGTVGGGAFNRAGNYDSFPNNAWYSTVSGGYYNRAIAQFATIGGGWGNQANGDASTVPGGYYNTAAGDNSFAAGRRAKANHQGAFVWGDSTDADIASTAANQFLVRASGGVTLTVGSGALRLLPEATSPNLIGGSSSNWITTGVSGATIGGGGWSSFPNFVTDAYGTVGGGVNNRAGNVDATLDNAANATVGGGQDNQASGLRATVGGGRLNVASGQCATVPGGNSNTAAGDHSLAAGLRAKANHNGSFVWADGNNFDFASAATNQFSARATGGVRFVLGIDGSGNPDWTCSVVDGGSWSCSSDRALKENLVLAEPQQALEQLAKVPVYYWNAKGGGARHIGPMAQDFAASFAVGENNTSLATIDLDGVAMAAIQGLYAENQELKAQVEDLKARLTTLEQAGDVARLPQASPANTWLLLAGLGLAGGVVWRRSRARGGQ